MSRAKRTDWIPATSLPARDGVYEREMPYGVEYSRWDGWLMCWHGDRRSVERAQVAIEISYRQMCPWRGLKHKPRGVK